MWDQKHLLLIQQVKENQYYLEFAAKLQKKNSDVKSFIYILYFNK